MIDLKIISDIQQCLDNKGYLYGDFNVETQANPKFGDYSSNVAMVSCKQNQIAPRQLAEDLAKELIKKKDYEKAEVAGPGFLNITLDKSVFHKALAHIKKQKENWGSSEVGRGKKVLIEFISANPTGPLNIVSARAAAFGDCLYRVFSFLGYKALREFYINDAGNQVDILAESLDLRYRELHGEVIKEFPIDAYHGEYVVELAAKLNSIEGQKLLSIAEKDKLAKMKAFALEEIHNMQSESLASYGVEIDSWVSEKALRKQGIVQEVLSYLTEAGCTYEKDDAIWFSSSKYGDEKDRVLMKSDGSYTYFVPDIGYHITKFQRGYETLIDVLGPDHHGYVPRLKAAISALGYEQNMLEIIYLQQVNLFSEGEKVKMSKRLGTIVTMSDLIEEVGKDAARFFFLDRRPSAHLNFDLDLAKAQTSENPVFYCQYAHARICSILKKAKKEKKVKLDKIKVGVLAKLTEESEINIIKKLMSLPTVLQTVANLREPQKLTAWVLELAGIFHKYYQKHHILNLEDDELMEARLYLINVLANTMAIALGLLGVDAPEKM